MGYLELAGAVEQSKDTQGCSDMLCELRQDYDMLEVWVREKYAGLDTLDELTKLWAAERNLIKGSTPDKQMLKLMEEVGELAGGLAKQNPEVVKDSIGDCLVVLSILAAQSGLGMQECWLGLERTSRTVKGQMVFVKQEDLQSDLQGDLFTELGELGELVEQIQNLLRIFEGIPHSPTRTFPPWPRVGCWNLPGICLRRIAVVGLLLESILRPLESPRIDERGAGKARVA